jgi:competence protein ComFC
MAEALARASPGGTPSGLVLTWVPLGRRRRRERGYDQAEVLAKAVGRLTGISAVPLLRRETETAPQARRSGAERRLALAGAFRAAGAAPARVVLVDDVLTSGATAAECARTLIEAGALEVGVLTAARALGGPLPARCYTPAVGLLSGSVVARERFFR